MGHNAATEKTAAEAKERRTKFLEALRGEDGGPPATVRQACAAAGVSRRTVDVWRRDDPEFAEQYGDCFEDGTDLLETVAHERAVNGVADPIFNKDGEQVGERRKYSDDLLKFTLAGRRPERYREGTTVNVQQNSIAVIDNTQVARALALMLATAKSKQGISQ